MFGEHLYEEVLEKVLHRHIVFTIPKRLRGFFRYDRGLNTILFQAARSALYSVVAPDADNGTIGAVLGLQTFGKNLAWNPHLHGLLANGGKPNIAALSRHEKREWRHSRFCFACSLPLWNGLSRIMAVILEVLRTLALT